MTTLKITGMTCDSCAVHVKEALEKVPGVQSANVSYTKGSAKLAVETGTSPDALTAAVAGLGYRATLADALVPPVGGGERGVADVLRTSIYWDSRDCSRQGFSNCGGIKRDCGGGRWHLAGQSSQALGGKRQGRRRFSQRHLRACHRAIGLVLVRACEVTGTHAFGDILCQP